MQAAALRDEGTNGRMATLWGFLAALSLVLVMTPQLASALAIHPPATPTPTPTPHTPAALSPNLMAPSPALYGIAAPGRPVVVTTVAQCTKILNDPNLCEYRLGHPGGWAYLTWDWQRTPCGFAVNCLDVQYFYLNFGSVHTSAGRKDRSRWLMPDAADLAPCASLTALAIVPPFHYQAQGPSYCFTVPIKSNAAPPPY